MTDEKTQQPIGVASDLNNELCVFLKKQYSNSFFKAFSAQFTLLGKMTLLLPLYIFTMFVLFVSMPLAFLIYKIEVSAIWMYKKLPKLPPIFFK